ncbi:hypothetical protein AUK04_01680 [Candidatus Roizmanbacteria bacterium CG2_30_33_16]|uniref:Uncharacterized protein n=3 Tax=Candidatus Roizmaniibacteriota TaxID=1752723 RepID=A0A2H0C2W6_9BACT|nr:MAG: hypothetical protein AUK04_01680 [Candidatus Roizmanbacteria bacterium CG2_30_33_16]PIP64253.1 MAG: hypothetical protein COW96_03500 [Candidatus Roizmanbacteria bacterium CG22_combo_CG10-13_8_21_14_all_33_16]PIX74099.1 MAG: hypothetical protein COZ39_01020 [Candidatus Roizmanbacteria bacterium CG_4_10_14_3_um_filter_33_21]
MKLNVKNVLFGIVLIILVGLVINVYLPEKDSVVKGDSTTQTVDAAQEAEIPNIKKADKIEVVNFHATQRCYSCTTLGKLSEKTVTEHFAPEIANGKIIFKSVNVELPENEKIVNLYQASGSSLYINAIKDGKNNIVQNMKVWQYISDEATFTSYLEAQLRSLL